MAVIKSGASTDQLTVDATSKAARVTLYDTAGNSLITNSVLQTGTTIVVDSNNTTTSTLGAGGSYTGTATNILGYTQINVSIFGRPGVVAGDGSSAKATFYFEFSPDGTNWDTSVPALIRDPSLVIPVPVINVGKFFRVRYLNDGGVAAIAALGLSDTAGTPTAQTSFRLTTYLLPQATKELSRTLDQGISGSDPVSLTRTVLMGKDPNGSFVNSQENGQLNSNTTVVALGSSATFTGTYFNSSSYSSACVNILTDQAGTLNIDYSNDASTIVRTVSYSILASTVFTTIFALPNEYFRIRYVNGAVAQGSMNLETVLKLEPLTSTIQTVSSGIQSNALALLTNSVPVDGVKQSYSATATGIASAAAATDIFTITGSATKTIRVTYIAVTGTQTTAGDINLLLIKRSTANSGGTSAAATAVPHDSSNTAATATVLSYTANPTVGTAVGTVRSSKMFAPGVATAAEPSHIFFTFGDRPEQSMILRGTSQVLAVNLNGATVTGGSFNVAITWVEE